MREKDGKKQGLEKIIPARLKPPTTISDESRLGCKLSLAADKPDTAAGPSATFSRHSSSQITPPSRRLVIAFDIKAIAQNQTPDRGPGIL